MANIILTFVLLGGTSLSAAPDASTYFHPQEDRYVGAASAPTATMPSNDYMPQDVPYSSAPAVPSGASPVNRPTPGPLPLALLLMGVVGLGGAARASRRQRNAEAAL